MNLQTSALNKGRRAVSYNVQSLTTCLSSRWRSESDGLRSYGSERGLASQSREDQAKEHVKELAKKQRAKKEAKAVDKDFFLSVLESSATKREAKSYLQRFTLPKGSIPRSAPTSLKADAKSDISRGNGVNLGQFYAPAAVEKSPLFVQQPGQPKTFDKRMQIHVALVKLRAPQTLGDKIIEGIGRTLSQLARLGLISVVVIDCKETKNLHTTKECLHQNWRALGTEQADRIINAIDSNGLPGARMIDNVIGISEKSMFPGQTKTHVTLRNLLMTPLRRSIIPVIPSVGYTDASQIASSIVADDAILALARELAGLPTESELDEDPNVMQSRLKALREEVSLDRLIILDPLGGIPNSDRPNGCHVFLNMEQEFESVQNELVHGIQLSQQGLNPNKGHSEPLPSDLGPSNPLSNFIESELGGMSTKRDNVFNLAGEDSSLFEQQIHLQNLQLVRSVLSMLPPSSSAILTTPDEATNSGKDVPFQPARVGTRRQRNPLIHNLLTDKPIYSSSLPVSRLHSTSSNETALPRELIVPTTFAKHGMSVTMFPDPKLSPWKSPAVGEPHLTLTGSQIDLPRLVHLIEDSFGRKLDVQDYLARVNGRIAGVIIAGEYEGGALLTWETPPGVPDDGSPESRARMVPYLDKFAVLKRSQGSGGVADLIFKAMVRTCFPNGVVWRSRKNNPVNKWYFERSRGTWKLPGEGWTMFWTTPDLSIHDQLFLDYAGVCRQIKPSWADNKAILD